MENEDIEFPVDTLPQRVAALRGIVNLLVERGYANPQHAHNFLTAFDNRPHAPLEAYHALNQAVIGATERLLQAHGVSYWSQSRRTGQVFLIVSVRPLPQADTFGDVWNLLENYIGGC